jgi:hypothetical protein
MLAEHLLLTLHAGRPAHSRPQVADFLKVLVSPRTVDGVSPPRNVLAVAVRSGQIDDQNRHGQAKSYEHHRFWAWFTHDGHSKELPARGKDKHEQAAPRKSI